MPDFQGIRIVVRPIEYAGACGGSITYWGVYRQYVYDRYHVDEYKLSTHRDQATAERIAALERIPDSNRTPMYIRESM